MQALTRETLMSLEQYAAIRPKFRADVLAHKRDRQLAIGPHATLYFEEASRIGFLRSVVYGISILKTLVKFKLHKKRIVRSGQFG